MRVAIMYQVIQNGEQYTQHDDGEQMEQLCKQILKCLSQATVIGLMVLSTMEVLTGTTGLVHLMSLTDISCSSVLAVFILAISMVVLTVSL